MNKKLYRTFCLNINKLSTFSEITQVRQCLQIVGLLGQLGLDSLYFGDGKRHAMNMTSIRQ